MSIKKTLDQFINEAQHSHKDENGVPIYSYNHIKEYINNLTKLPVFCPVKDHGIFMSRPTDHIRGAGCPKCAYDKKSLQHRLSLEEFIRKARLVHGDKYDYSKVDYVNVMTRVIIICPKHGEFEQRPNDHLRGAGCTKCYHERSSKDKFMGGDKFKKRSTIKHKGKYTYDNTIYTGATTKVIITCPEHGDFEQLPNMHLQGRGCPRCKESKGETKIANYLDQQNISYIREYRLDGYKYRYDFYLEGYNLLIEFHGGQHYESREYYGGKKAFKKRVKHDKAKVELAKRNGIELLVISYLEIEQVEEILKYELHTKVKNSKIVDISHVYELYCNIDSKKNNLHRYHNILYSYLKDEDMSNTMSKYHLLNNKHDEITKLLKDTMDIFKSIFIRLLVIENKMLVETVKAYKDGHVLR